MKTQSELRPELIGLVGINPFFHYSSPSRLQMFCSHIGQSLVVAGATPKRLQSGLEREFGKYTFGIKMPEDGTILKVLEKYPKTMDYGSIASNPLIVIIYEKMNDANREIDIVEIPVHHCIHQYYGFKYKHKPIMQQLTVGKAIAKGTVLADSPTVSDNGDHMYGLEAEVCLMSTHQCIEDAMVISKSFAKRLTTKGFGSRVLSFGKNNYPLNLEGYGTPDNPKAFPDIGDRIRPDGLIAATREFDDMLSVVDMTRENMQKPNYNFDKLIYGEPNAKVIDIIIHKNYHVRPSTPVGLEVQCEKYMSRTRNFYSQLTEYYNALRRKNPQLKISPNFHRLLAEGIAVLDNDSKDRVSLMFNRVQIDDWRVEVVYEYDMEPGIGAKLTCNHGGKGVISAIWDDARMPVDKWGKRADVIVDDTSTIKRMNIGRLYEQYINAAGAYIRHHLPAILNDRSPDAIAAAWTYLSEFIAIASPATMDVIRDLKIDADPLSYIEDYIRDGHYFWMPTDYAVDYLKDVVGVLTRKYPDIIGPLQYTGNSGIPCQTVKPILIGSMYFMLLEKTANTATAVASAKLQHFGIPAKLTNDDKYSTPVWCRPQPTRIFGEDEVRLIAATAGGKTIADLLDQTNNPQVHKEVVQNILKATKPTNIRTVVNRRKFPMGNGRMLSYTRHVLECAGIRFVKRRPR